MTEQRHLRRAGRSQGQCGRSLGIGPPGQDPVPAGDERGGKHVLREVHVVVNRAEPGQELLHDQEVGQLRIGNTPAAAEIGDSLDALIGGHGDIACVRVPDADPAAVRIEPAAVGAERLDVCRERLGEKERVRRHHVDRLAYRRRGQDHFQERMPPVLPERLERDVQDIGIEGDGLVAPQDVRMQEARASSPNSGR